jgi:type III secretion protein C
MLKLLPKALVIVAALAWFIAPVQGLEPKWPPGPYKYLVIDQSIKDVLTEFGRNIDVPVEVSDQVKGRLRGRLPVATAKEFLNKLCESYGLVWYFDGATLHINAKTEVKTELINIGRLPPDQLTARLNALGIADPRFPVRTTPNGGVVSVSGPPPFVTLVRQTLTAMARMAPPPAVQNTHPRSVQNKQTSAVQNTKRITIWRNLSPKEYDLPDDAAH